MGFWREFLEKSKGKKILLWTTLALDSPLTFFFACGIKKEMPLWGQHILILGGRKEMKKHVSILAVLLMAIALSVSLGGCASSAAGKSTFDGTLDFTKVKGEVLENNTQPDKSMFWIDHSWADFDRAVFKDAAPSVRWLYGKSPIPEKEKWWQGFGVNDIKWDLSGFTHVAITYMASRTGDTVTFTLSEAHSTEARECSTTFTPEVANEWVTYTAALEDFTTGVGANYQGKRFAKPVMSNITGWLFGAGTVENEDGVLWIDSVVFTAE